MRGDVVVVIVLACLILGMIPIPTIGQPTPPTEFEGEIEDKDIRISKTEGGYIIGLCNNLWASELDVFFDGVFQGTIPPVKLYRGHWENFYVTDKVEEIVVQGTGIHRDKRWHCTVSDEDWPPDTPPKSMEKIVVDEIIEIGKGKVTAEVLKTIGENILANSGSLTEVIAGYGIKGVGVVMEKTTIPVWVIQHAGTAGGGGCKQIVVVVKVWDASSNIPARRAKVKTYWYEVQVGEKTISVPLEQKAIENVEGMEPPEGTGMEFSYQIYGAKFCKNAGEAQTYMSSGGIKSADMNEALNLIKELELEKEGLCI